ncbi:MAG: PDZ domain-containing protein [Phycisphaerae bacterium]|jgi:tricorn protease
MRLNRLAVLASLLPVITYSAQGGPVDGRPMGLATSASAAWGTTTETKPHPAMLRYPDVSATQIVFVYADDLWLVSRKGGQATPLASPPGAERFPKFNKDGTRIAFVGNYAGNRDLYAIPVGGGVPTRVTHHPARETLCDWTPDGELLFFASGFSRLPRQARLMTVSPEGGLPTALPPPYGANGAISPGGEWLAYTPHSRDHRTWKRYRGGMATDIWLFNLTDHRSRRITDWEGTDSQPMWHGDTVYYLSDAGEEHRLNVWAFDVASGRREQVTRFADYDVKWPSIGPGPQGDGEIVLQNGSALYLVDLSTKQSRSIQVTIPGDRPTLRAHHVDAGEFVNGWGISPTAKRAVVSARGDIWTIPAKHGSPRNLTRTDGVADRDPAWSPDGQWVAYLSDASGEYELHITQSDGNGETRQLTHLGGGFRSRPTWSPDSKHLAVVDNAGAIHLHTIETGTTKVVDRDPWAGRPRVSWSHDARWLAYTKSGDNRHLSIWLHEIESAENHQLTSDMFTDTWPTFDREGDYLFFASNREISSPIYDDLGTSFVYANTDLLVVVPLGDEVGSPWAPKSDEEKWGDEAEEDDTDADNEDDEDESADDGDEETPDDDVEKDAKEKQSDDEDQDKPVVIELEGFEQRALKVPVKRGNFYNLAVTHDGKLVYTRGAARGTDGKPSIQILDIKEGDEKKREKTVVEDAADFRMSANGKKLLVRKDEKWAVIDAKPEQKLDKTLSVKNLTTRIDPRREWSQLFTDAWRIERDFFYDPTMHGLDWDAVREHYAAMLDDCVSRRDVAYVIGEMIAELNVGHAYVRSAGDVEDEPEVGVGMLGVDYELKNGAYRIAKIYQGAPWDLDARGPLSEPGVDVNEGDYLLAVNGVALDVTTDPWAAFRGLDNAVVTLTVGENPTLDDGAREVVVKTLRSENNLRYRAWIEANRQYVSEKSGGRVGYVYVPNTGVRGQNDLIRQFQGQVTRDALIIDERWNGGGQIPTRFIELLNRPTTNYWARRHGHDSRWPPDSHQGPKCMLINGLAGSGGDCFPYYFRQAKLGKLIGTRTWGGLVGISGNPQLIDGGRLTAPTFAFYENDGTWGVEGHGVDPDIEVIDDPALMTEGGDPQLDAAIEQMLVEIEQSPYVPPRRPDYPDRSGMGIREEDK